MRKILTILILMIFSITLIAQEDVKTPPEKKKESYAFVGLTYSFEWQRPELYPGIGLFYGQIIKNGYGFYTNFTYSNQDSRYGKGENAKGYMYHLGYLQDTRSGIVHWYLGVGVRHDIFLDKLGVSYKYNTPSFDGGIILTPKIGWMSFLGGLQVDTYDKTTMKYPKAFALTSNFNWRFNVGVVFTPMKMSKMKEIVGKKWRY